MRTRVILVVLIALAIAMALPTQTFAVKGNGESWYIRAYNVDDAAYMYANGVKVGPDVKYLGDSGWVNITSYVNSKSRAATVRFLCWNGGGPYKYTFQLARKFSGSGETLQVVKTWSASYGGSDRTNRWVFDSGHLALGTIIGDQFGAPTDVYPTARNGGYQGYGDPNWYYSNRYHSGADVNSTYGASAGRNVRATAAGKVVQRTGNINGWGYTVLIEHNFAIASTGKVYSQYSHMSSISAPAVGQTVTKGQIIGKVGGTGGNTSFAPHLHFEIKRYNAGGSVFGIGYYPTAQYPHPSSMNPRYFDPYYIIVGY